MPTLFLALKCVPSGPQLSHESNLSAREESKELSREKNQGQRDSFKQNLLDFYATAKFNKPFHIYLGAAFFFYIASGMFFGLLFLYIDTFLGLGDKFASLSLMGIILSLLITPLCYQLVISIGKKRSWIIANSTMLIGILYSGLVSVESANFTSLLVIYGAFFLGNSISTVSMLPIYADVLDYGAILDKTDRKAMYLSISVFLLKAEAALAASLGFWIAGWFGFDPAATYHDEQSTFAIRLAMSWVPLVIMSFSLYFIWKMPLTDHRMAIVRRRLNARATRAAATP